MKSLSEIIGKAFFELSIIKNYNYQVLNVLDN